MEAVTITQITPAELESLIENSIKKVFALQSKEPQTQTDEVLTVKDAAKFLSLSVPTIYGLISKGEIPVMKRSKRCYFSRVELVNYLQQGRKKTNNEISLVTDVFLSSKRK